MGQAPGAAPESIPFNPTDAPAAAQDRIPTGTPVGRIRQTFIALEERDFRIYWLGQLVSVTGTLNVIVMVGPRLPFAMAERGQLPSVFADLHPRFHTPWVSILVSAVVMNAIMDALAPLGVTELDMPATPSRVWQAIQKSHGRPR